MLTRDNTFVRTWCQKYQKKILEDPENCISQKNGDITYSESCFIILHNMVIDSCKSGCNMLKGTSRLENMLSVGMKV